MLQVRGIDVDEIDVARRSSSAQLAEATKVLGDGPERVAGAEAERQAGDMQRRGRAVDRHRVLRAAVLGHGLLEARRRPGPGSASPSAAPRRPPRCRRR